MLLPARALGRQMPGPLGGTVTDDSVPSPPWPPAPSPELVIESSLPHFADDA